MRILLFLITCLPLFAAEGRIALLRESASVQDLVIEGITHQLQADDELVIWNIAEEREQVLIQQIKHFQPDLIIPLGNTSLELARKDLAKIPRIAGMVLKKRDILHSELETGIYLEFDPAVQMDWLQRILPTTRVVGILYSPGENHEFVRELEVTARERGLELIAVKIFSPRDIPNGFRQLEGSIDVLLGVFDSIVLTRETARPLISYCFHQKLPFMSVSQSWARAGALIAMDRDYTDYGRQLGLMSRTFFSGQALINIEPSDPDKPQLYFNQRTAETIKVFPAEAALQDINIIKP